MPTLTMPRLADSLVAPAKMSLSYAEALCNDIPADKFAHMPHPKMNHPAFNIGHLSLYPNRMFTMLGMTERVKEKQGWDLLFKAGVECVERDGHYPPKAEIMEHYLNRYQSLIEALPSVPEEVFGRRIRPRVGSRKSCPPWEPWRYSFSRATP